MGITSTQSAEYLNTTVTVAPLVLLSVVDHYERILNSSNASANSAVNSNKRVIGVILGDNTTPNTIKVTNSFAIPFEEDSKNPDIWFLDHNYIDNMLEMSKKINAKEKLLGWYHSGPKLKSSDLQINSMFKKFNPNPLLLIVDVNQTNQDSEHDHSDIPTDSYLQIDEIKDDGTSSEPTFIHLPSIIQAEEAEEIGVEHLLRDIRDQACGNLSIKLTNNFKSLKSLNERLINIVNYLNKIIEGQLPINNIILGKLQDILNLLPNLNLDVQPKDSQDTQAQQLNGLSSAFNVRTNDELMIVYISSLIRSIIAFHDLIDNKLKNKELIEESNKKLTQEEAATEVAVADKE